MCGGSSDNAEDENFFSKAIGAITNVASAGGIDYGNGEFGRGVATERSLGFYKDISGASAAEEANADARERLQEEKAQALQDREDARAQNAADQLAASRRASATRGSTARGRATRSSQLGGEEQDFLGL